MSAARRYQWILVSGIGEQARVLLRAGSSAWIRTKSLRAAVRAHKTPGWILRLGVEPAQIFFGLLASGGSGLPIPGDSLVLVFVYAGTTMLV
jgi:hypothetical protein